MAMKQQRKNAMAKAAKQMKKKQEEEGQQKHTEEQQAEESNEEIGIESDEQQNDSANDEEEDDDEVSEHEALEEDDDDDDENDEEEAEDSGSDNGEEEDDDADTDDEPQNDAEDEDAEEMEAVGFGDAMSKILQQNVAEDAQPILAKRTTARMREIMNEKKETKTAKLSAAERRQREQKDMIIPDHTTIVQDRKLRMIATKGVVALFNAIEKHQHQQGKKDEADDKKVKEMSKENFLGLLKATQKATSTAASETPKASFLKDDYMMDAKKLKDWDATHPAASTSTKPPKKFKKQTDGDGDEEAENVEETAWKQVEQMENSDDEEQMKPQTKKRKAATKPAAFKKPKRN